MIDDGYSLIIAYVPALAPIWTPAPSYPSSHQPRRLPYHHLETAIFDRTMSTLDGSTAALRT
jgi:hypothetical protein